MYISAAKHKSIVQNECQYKTALMAKLSAYFVTHPVIK